MQGNEEKFELLLVRWVGKENFRAKIKHSQPYGCFKAVAKNCVRSSRACSRACGSGRT
jgi:hypothetical protein